MHLASVLHVYILVDTQESQMHVDSHLPIHSLESGTRSKAWVYFGFVLGQCLMEVLLAVPMYFDCRYEDYTFFSGEHGGTHIDSPRHFYKTGWTIEEIPLSRLLMLPLSVINVTAKANQDIDYLVRYILEFLYYINS